MNQQPMSRRTVLRGTGACLALPLLEAMFPRRVRADASFRAAERSVAAQPRMIFCYIPNGVNEEQWLPNDAGPNWTLSSTLEALKEYRADLTVLSGLGHPNSEGGHYGADTWLTGANLKGTPGKDYQNTISVDQVAAGVHGKRTRFPSLELSSGGGTGSAGHSHTLAFDHAGTPLPTESHPSRLFERLFTPEGEAARHATLKRYAERRSILDDIMGDAKALSRRLGKSDQHKVDEYLGSVREAEQRVERLQNWIDIPKPEVSRQGLQLNLTPHPNIYALWLEVMLELSYLSFQTDTTRIITFEWAREAGGWGPNGEDLHQYSHHGGDKAMLAKLAEINRFHVGKLARFLGLLKATREEEGNMLDNTMVLFGSGMNNGEGGGHSPKNLPLLLAGGRKRGIKHGSHLKFAIDSTPFSNVLLTMLRAMGAPEERFMDSSGTIPELVA